jgi:hypothetical protein
MNLLTSYKALLKSEKKSNIMNANDILKYGHYTVLSAIDGLNEPDWEVAGVCGIWSVRDIIAHLASYELMLIDVFTSVIDPNAPTALLSAYSGGVDAFNDDQVSRRRGYSIPEVLAEYNHLVERTQALLAQIPGSIRDQEGVLPWYGAEYDLDDFIVYTFYGHKREHCAQIAVFRDTLPQRPPQQNQRHD